MKILKLFIRNTKNKTINYKTNSNLSHLDTSKSNQIIDEIKKINEKYIKNEIETFNIIDTIKLNIKTEFYLSDNENGSNSVFLNFRQSRQEYNLFELKNKLPNNELSVQNICEYFNEKIIGICFKLNKKMFDNKKIKICLNNSNISIFDGSKSSQTNIDFEINVENKSKVFLHRLKSNLLKININNNSQLKFMEIISNDCKIYSNNSNITTTVFGKSIFKNFHCELNNSSKLELNEEINVKNIFKITSDKSITFIKLMHPIVNHFEYIGLNHSTAKFYILQNFKNVLNMFLGIELNQSHINMDIIENKKNGLQFKNIKFIKDLYSTHNINNNV